nr:4F2 cell-surface antigen heavy chain-like [Paramormyrops kingsleyae]
MSKVTEADMKDVELELDPEKQPMTDGGAGNSPIGTEKNGSVTVKIADDSDVKFTGLSKEELMKVAGTPGWVRTRWVLLILFWIGWIGMLAGAIVIIVKAPRCKSLPEMNWWNYGPLYKIWDVDAFTEAGGLKGVVEKIDDLSQLKVKGVVMGPLHTVQKDQPNTLNFMAINPEVGTNGEFESLVDKAHKKGLSVVLDLTPNYKGSNLWFDKIQVSSIAEKLKVAMSHWMDLGVDGFQLGGIDENFVDPSIWHSLKNTIKDNRTDGAKQRVLIGVSMQNTSAAVSTLHNISTVDLLLSRVLQPNVTGGQWAQAIQQLYESRNQTGLAWNIGSKTEGHLGTLVGPTLVKLYQMLLFTLPGTPVFSYGDEICLKSDVNATHNPKMVWDSLEHTEEKNETVKMMSEHRRSCHSFFKTLSDLRGKERSLQHGDFLLLHNSTTSLAFLRQWDQSERYLTALNLGKKSVTLRLSHAHLPEHATVLLSTDPKTHPPEKSVQLGDLKLEAEEAILLHFPYTA